MQDPEAVFCYERSAVRTHAADAFGNPGGITAEQFVIFLDTHEFYDAQLHDEVVDKFLRLRFGNRPLVQIALDIDVEKRRIPADTHRSAVLILDGGEIAEIQPLNGFLRVFGGTRNIEAVFRRHLFERAERSDLLGKLLPVADFFGQHFPVHQQLIFLFLCNQIIYAVQRDAAVIADDSPPAVGIGQAR